MRDQNINFKSDETMVNLSNCNAIKIVVWINKETRVI